MSRIKELFFIAEMIACKKSFHDQCSAWKRISKKCCTCDLDYLEQRLRGNAKVSLNFVQGELNGD